MAEVDLKSLIRKLNPLCTRALESAAGLCVSRNHYEITVEHCFHVMLENPNADLQVICKHFGVDGNIVLRAVQGVMEEMKAGNTGRPVFSPLLVDWFKQGWLISSLNYGLYEVRSGALLMSLLDNPLRFMGGDYEDTLAGVKKGELAEKFLDIAHESVETAQATKAAESKGGEKAFQPGDDSALGRFCQNFTDRARAGEIDPVFGRDREIRQMIDILARHR